MSSIKEALLDELESVVFKHKDKFSRRQADGAFETRPTDGAYVREYVSGMDHGMGILQKFLQDMSLDRLALELDREIAEGKRHHKTCVSAGSFKNAKDTAVGYAYIKGMEHIVGIVDAHIDRYYEVKMSDK